MEKLDFQWVEIPAGPFIMGRDDGEEREGPEHVVRLPTYYIAKYPVTVTQFAPFVEGDGYTNRDYWLNLGWNWKGNREVPQYWGIEPYHKDNNPVVGLSWFEAMAYAAWVNAHSDDHISLPTSAEWEKAARGLDGYLYPWGDRFSAHRANTEQTGIGTTIAVDKITDGDSSYGASGMVGNVWEWCITKHRDNYEDEDEDNKPFGAGHRVRRGGSFATAREKASAVYPAFDQPDRTTYEFGLRLVKR